MTEDGAGREPGIVGERHPGRSTRKPKWPDWVEVPDFTLEGGAARPDRYEATRTVLRRKGQPYVQAVVRLNRLGGVGINGRSLAYAMEGRMRSPYRYTADSRAHPPLGSRQRHEGAKALAALRLEVTQALGAAGWRALAEDSEWWQAPEGEAMDAAAERRAERRSLIEAVERVLDAVLEGRQADLVTAEYAGREWGVTGHRTEAGQAVVVLSPGLPVVEVPKGETTWHEGEG